MALFTLETRSGAINLVELHQQGTYSGIIEGYATASLNARLLERMPSEIRVLFGEDVPVHVIVPPSTGRDVGIPLPEPLLEMPPVWCAGRWVLQIDRGLVWVELLVGWFQEEAGVPVDAATLDALRSLDFESLGRWCEF